MSTIKLQSGSYHVVTSGLAYTAEKDSFWITIEGHSTDKHDRIDVMVHFKFYEHASEMPKFEADKPLPKQHQHHFTSVCTLNVSIEGLNVISKERIFCAEYPGGKMYITFQAFALPDSEQKGLYYTIYEYPD